MSPSQFTPLTQTQEDWEAFRFPTRTVASGVGRRSVSSDSEGDRGEDEEGGEEGGNEGSGYGSMALELTPPDESDWVYDSRQRAILHHRLRKKVHLSRLDEAALIVRLIAVFEKSDHLNVEGFVVALDSAAHLHYGCSLVDVLSRHADGRPLRWQLEEEPSHAQNQKHRQSP